MSRKKHPNDSSQMKELLQDFDPLHTKNEKPKHESQQKSKDSSTEASSSKPSTSGESCHEDTVETSERVPVGRKDSSVEANSSKPSTSGENCHEDTAKTNEGGTASSEVGFSCCQLDDLKKLPQCDIKRRPLTFSQSHIVLIDVKRFSHGTIGPQEGRDMWNNNFVKMPCSPSSLSPNPGVQMGPINLKMGPNQVQRWTLISDQLGDLVRKRAVKPKEVEEAILKYNPKYKAEWCFDALAKFGKVPLPLANHYEKLFSKIAALALKLPTEVKKAIPLLQRHRPAAITLSQVQISCLLANAFYCTFPHRNATRPNAEYHNYPSINFSRLFGSWSERKNQKLLAIMQYFNVMTDEKSKPEGLVTFERCCLSDKDTPSWGKCKDTLQKLHVTSEGKIEHEGTGLLQVDFAASRIGGGVLDSGLVQEEILFLMHPELILSRLFTEKLDDKECLIITGAQQFSCYDGFSDSFRWIGPFDDHLDRDEWRRLKRQIVAIDALNFKHHRDQYNMASITRELNKAYCGFKVHHGIREPDVATGKWGCGAFKGDPQLKALVQLMAAAKARRGLAFFTFGDKNLKKDLQDIYLLLVKQKTTVGQLYELLEDYCTLQHKSGGSHEGVFDFLRKTIRQFQSLL